MEMVRALFILTNQIPPKNKQLPHLITKYLFMYYELNKK